MAEDKFDNDTPLRFPKPSGCGSSPVKTEVEFLYHSYPPSAEEMIKAFGIPDMQEGEGVPVARALAVYEVLRGWHEQVMAQEGIQRERCDRGG